MSEPEEVLLDGAHIATEYVARLWRRHTKGAPVAGLADTRRRLETLLAALYSSPLPIVPAEAPARPTLFGRLARLRQEPRCSPRRARCLHDSEQSVARRRIVRAGVE